MEQIKDTLRIDVINNTNNLDKRLSKLYDLIENELLGPLVCSSNYISSYKVRLSWEHTSRFLSFKIRSDACSPLHCFRGGVHAHMQPQMSSIWP